VEDQARATVNVMLNVVTSFGIADILGGKKGFINFDYHMLMNDSIEILPKDQVVIELLESIEPTPELVERCRFLKEEGFQLALDDHIFHPRFEELYGIVDLVKIDLLQTPRKQLPDVVMNLKPYPLGLLAEKVECRTIFEECRSLGFEYFQGYYFAKPSILQKKKMTEDMMTLLKLLRLLSEDAEIHNIEELIRNSPALVYKVLILVNSTSFGSRRKIQSIRHAICMVGKQQLKRWVQLSLFASEFDNSFESPLMDMAATRAVFMEQLARSHPLLRQDDEAPERAFMAGILSLLERIYHLEIDEVIEQLNLDDDVISALVRRSGIYGGILRVAEHVEALEFRAASDELTRMGIALESVSDLQMQAFSWKKRF
jgi:c-di-GMP-related signal transduction protein